jgi:hypothetical protein
METEWLNILQIPNKYRQKSIIIDNKKYRIDAYDPLTNTIYEFYGDFWHGNPKKYNKNDFNIISKKTFGQLYKNTMKREKLFEKSNFNVISIWELDFKQEHINGS